MEDPLNPPANVRILELRAEPWPDGQRVRIHVQISPFEQRPNLEILVQNQAGEEVSSVNIIELMDQKFVITMHIQMPDPENKYTLSGRLFYPEQEDVDSSSYSFEILTPGIPDEG